MGNDLYIHAKTVVFWNMVAKTLTTIPLSKSLKDYLNNDIC